MKQKEVFLLTEGDAWFNRNHPAVSQRLMDETDPVIDEIFQIIPFLDGKSKSVKILEIGCGEGKRLEWLEQKFVFDVYGVEPSGEAVELACQRGVKAQRGCADHLPFESSNFDILIFGCCLYLCDRDDLFKIACEADRVLKNSSWIIIHDFFSPTHVKREYHHQPGLYSYKMDYRTLFTWHPAYTCFAHQVRHCFERVYTDEPIEWAATSVLRKNLS